MSSRFRVVVEKSFRSLKGERGRPQPFTPKKIATSVLGTVLANFQSNKLKKRSMLDWNRISWKFNGSKSWLLPQLAEDHWNDTSMVSFLYVPGIVAHFFSYPVRMSLFNAHENHVDTLGEAMQQHILAQLLPEGKNNSYVYFPSNPSSPITITDISLHSVFRDAHASWSSPFPLQT